MHAPVMEVKERGTVTIRYPKNGNKIIFTTWEGRDLNSRQLLDKWGYGELFLEVKKGLENIQSRYPNTTMLVMPYPDIEVLPSGNRILLYVIQSQDRKKALNAGTITLGKQYGKKVVDFT